MSAFGRTNATDPASITRFLQYATLLAVSQSVCVAKFELNFRCRGCLPVTDVCAASDPTSANPTKDSCFGDSGGPLVRVLSGGVKKLWGVVASMVTNGGPACGVPGEYGLYVAVPLNLVWIANVTTGKLNASAVTGDPPSTTAATSITSAVTTAALTTTSSAGSASTTARTVLTSTSQSPTTTTASATSSASTTRTATTSSTSTASTTPATSGTSGATTAPSTTASLVATMTTITTIRSTETTMSSVAPTTLLLLQQHRQQPHQRLGSLEWSRHQVLLQQVLKAPQSRRNLTPPL